MREDAEIVQLKLDLIFKKVFGDAQNTDVIAEFISAMLDIPRESIHLVEIRNTEMTPDFLGLKFGRLDLCLEVDEQLVDIEMQVNQQPNYAERSLFYWSKLYTSSLQSGDDYGVLRRAICINILNYNLFDCEDYRSHFMVMEKERGEVLTDKFGVYFFELKKVKHARKYRRAQEWLELINAETEGDLMAIEEKTNSKEIKKTIVRLRELSADEQLREQYRLRQKAMMDERNAIHGSYAEGVSDGISRGRAEGEMMKENAIAARMRKLGFSEEDIQRVLDLS